MFNSHLSYETYGNDTPGPIKPRAAPWSKDFPFTLDLRTV